MLATLRKSVSLYTLLSLLIGAQGAILVFVHQIGNVGADAVAGSVLAGLALLVTIGHGFFAGLQIPVPAGVLTALTTINGIIVVVLAGAGMIVQYIGSVEPALTPWVALALQGAALVGSLLAQFFKAAVSARQARAAAKTLACGCKA